MSNYIETAFMQQRTDFMKTLPDRRKRFSIPDDVDMYLDIEYVNDQNEAHRLDVFRPSESPDKELPIIFNVHGGGLIMGCKEFNRYFCARLCKLGYVVFSIEYRLVPEYTFYHRLYLYPAGDEPAGSLQKQAFHDKLRHCEFHHYYRQCCIPLHERV